MIKAKAGQVSRVAAGAGYAAKVDWATGHRGQCQRIPLEGHKFGPKWSKL